MDYRFFEGVDRYEIAKEDIILHHEVINPDTKAKTEHTDLRETGCNIFAHYYMQIKYETDSRLTDEQITSINNAIRALMLLKGEKSVDEQLIAKFIKKSTGVKVASLRVELASKTYSFTYRGGGKYQSDEINLKPLVTKNL